MVLNIIGLNIGKWLQNAGGVGTYLPLLILIGVAVAVYLRHGSATHFTFANMMPTWNWDTVNFWSQIAFAFTGLELVSCMAEEVHNPRRTLPRAVFGAGASIADPVHRRERLLCWRSFPRATSIRKAAFFMRSLWALRHCVWDFWECWRRFW